MILKVGIFIFPDIETLDFCGPLEVFSAANIAGGETLFDVYTFAETNQLLRTINGLQVVPGYNLANTPQPDILILPGGNGTKQVIQKGEVMDALLHLHHGSQYTFSVCSGARILAVAGLLNGLNYTTHHSVFNDLKKLAPSGHAKPGKRFTDNGKILTSAGVAAGIDLSFYLLDKIKGRKVAIRTAGYMEYPLTFAPHNDKNI
jgi:transcriptional regulator GlxA family with amidase domain